VRRIIFKEIDKFLDMKKIITLRNSKIEIDQGDLILFNYFRQRGNSKAPIFGIFADIVDRFVCFAEQPYSLETSVLPSGVRIPLFLPRHIQEVGRDYRGNSRPADLDSWPFNYSVCAMGQITVGKDNITAKLKEDSSSKYAGHIEIIEMMKPPYINDQEVRQMLGI